MRIKSGVKMCSRDMSTGIQATEFKNCTKILFIIPVWQVSANIQTHGSVYSRNFSNLTRGHLKTRHFHSLALHTWFPRFLSLFFLAKKRIESGSSPLCHSTVSSKAREAFVRNVFKDFQIILILLKSSDDDAEAYIRVTEFCAQYIAMEDFLIRIEYVGRPEI